jgi:hypothetical protein
VTDAAAGKVEDDSVRGRVVARLPDQLDLPTESRRCERDTGSGPTRRQGVAVQPADGRPDDDDHELRVRGCVATRWVSPDLIRLIRRTRVRRRSRRVLARHRRPSRRHLARVRHHLRGHRSVRPLRPAAASSSDALSHRAPRFRSAPPSPWALPTRSVLPIESGRQMASAMASAAPRASGGPSAPAPPTVPGHRPRRTAPRRQRHRRLQASPPPRR